MSDSPAPRTASPAARRIAVAAVFLASITLCLLAYLALAAPGPWFGGAQTLRWAPKELTVTRGTAQRTRDGLAITAADATRTVVISITTSFRSRDYAVIAWDAAGVPDNVEATLLWYNDYAPARVFKRALTVEAGRIAPASVVEDRGWLGRVGGLALVLQGGFTEPIMLHGAAAKPMSASQVLRDRLGEWLAFEPWNGTSINTLTGGADAQDMPLPVLLAAIACMAALAYAALARWKRDLFGPVLGAAIAGVFVIAWLIIDARWQWNLLRQVRSTHAQYAGKSWQERHLAAEDGPVFAFIEKVREQLPAPPARVFMVADAHYFRDRGAYHLYPYNVYFDPWVNSMPPPSAMRPGDYIVVYQRRGVQYDPAQRRLRWDGSATVDAELLLVDKGAALFRIR
ncbi:MAG TPA: hypothetical protein VF014_07580 [Casimicrobiaceae bacterium]|nr:hypothetical protein [Casimicrobiaceae bacterium]